MIQEEADEVTKSGKPEERVARKPGKKISGSNQQAGASDNLGVSNLENYLRHFPKLAAC